MNTELISLRSPNIFKFLDFKKEHTSFAFNGFVSPENQLPEILFITSLPSRECGIATYTQDLVNALNDQFSNSFQCSICALETDTEQPNYKSKPKFILNTDSKNAFAKTAFLINRDENVKLVVIQHEFGFFVENEAEFRHLYTSIIKPIVFVFHTVLPNPNLELSANVKEMAAVASSIIVMTQNACDILTEQYQIPSNKITVLPHGTHLVASIDRNKLKKQYGLSDRKILSTFGLLSSGKSIETTLNALPAIVKTHPTVLFWILGKTHPSVVKQEGEKYRDMLEAKVDELKIRGHVRFVNEYLALPILLEYLQLTDIYLFTSKDPNQAVSGTFSYAVSSGCPVISTPIPHAKEVLNQNNGMIIDFENSEQLAQNVVKLLDNEKLRREITLNSLHKMASTAWQNSAIAHALLFKNLTDDAFQLNYRIPTINFNHLRKMTTDFGLVQFAKLDSPDIQSDYTLDDNARALIAICQHYEMYQNENDLSRINTYLNFIEFCMQTNGVFLNYVSEQRVFTRQNDAENLEDSNGRAIWALGYLISLKKILPEQIIEKAENLMAEAIPYLDNNYSTRAMALMIKGLYYQNKKENLLLLEVLTDRLVQMYKHEKTKDWHWFENSLTYGNALLPEALLCAYLRTSNLEYKKIAKESFDFLLSKIFIEGKIKVISNKEWHVRDRRMETPIGVEQPIDVAYTIMTLEKFLHVFNKDEYKQKAIIAFNWFLGNNHLNQIVYNPCTGGCYDGIEEYNVNLNQGAESTVCYLLARLTIERIMDYKKQTLKHRKSELLLQNHMVNQ
jgi:glycosyltransferase involved in cell wall biosynthesis